MLFQYNFLYQCQVVLYVSNYRHFCCDLSLDIVCRPEWDLNPGHWISGCNGYTTSSICLPQVCLFLEMFKYNIQCTVQRCYWYTNNTFLNRSNECASCLCIWPKRKNKICVSALMLLTDWITACPMALYSCIKKSTVGKIKICDNLNNMQVPGPTFSKRRPQHTSDLQQYIHHCGVCLQYEEGEVMVPWAVAVLVHVVHRIIDDE